MGIRVGVPGIDAVVRSIRTTVLSPFRPQTYLNLLYLALAFPLGVAYFVVLTVGFSFGLSLLILVIGAPILLVVLLATHALAAFERAMARYLLSVEIDSPGYPFLEREGVVDRLRSLLLGRETYASVCFLLSKFVVGIASFVLLTTLLTTAAAMVLTPLFYDSPNVSVGFITDGEPVFLTPSLQLPWDGLLVGVEVAVTLTEWEVTTLPEALATSIVGVLFLAVSLAICNVVARILGQFSRLMLGQSVPGPIADPTDRIGR
ncbi:sensor domain-containing protein [Halosolutus amylolyticus]|uniref:Sensor domain-containing protein n=1 Tax=Halosolutus amylolyticus TaxID=2932267 RepID=A0ABD5PKU8_9EURY|nr:sensor domain-containing protein [Halosolutus amylolyticus]